MVIVIQATVVHQRDNQQIPMTVMTKQTTPMIHPQQHPLKKVAISGGVLQ